MSLKITEYFRKYFGMHQGSAQWKLYKQIMFNQAVRLNENICYQCGERIDNIDEFSIEHKIPWLFSENPKELYFRQGNLAWSHSCCNNKAKRKPSKQLKKELGLS
jgi:hypothetical protein